MRGKLTKIHPLKAGGNGQRFIRLEFELDDGGWAKTDLCPSFRNFRHWQPHLRVGACLSGLKLKSPSTIDADGKPMPCRPLPTAYQGDLPL